MALLKVSPISTESLSKSKESKGSESLIAWMVITPEHTVEYQHNALGHQVLKKLDGTVIEKYLWQNKTTLLDTYDANNNLLQRFEYALGTPPRPSPKARTASI
jgi:hypothetical protein